MQWLITLATAMWAFWQWSHERDQERKKERETMAALYVKPFLSACEDLQSRIYNILEMEGLQALRERYPDGTYAEETLYLIVRYFGWLATVLRYSPYPNDRELIGFTEAVRAAFASSKHPIGAFTFFSPEQKALGKIVMQRFKGQHGIELDTIPFYEFKDLLKSPPLCESNSLKQSIEALRNAQGAAGLEGRKRLAQAQNFLVDLLIDQEDKMGLSLFAGERQKCFLSLEQRPSASSESKSTQPQKRRRREKQ
ncbi:MAG TPA: hypothetical protein EYP19_04430 [Desulfobacterales bacterium]|nr:hypothetical protein [Desulfobacterales bacterium]